MNNPKLHKGQNVFFIGEVLPMVVNAVNDNYAVCTRNLHRRHDADLLHHKVETAAYLSFSEAYNALKEEIVYTILDFHNKAKGPHNLVFNLYAFEEPESVEELLRDLEAGKVELSRRNSVALEIDWDRTEGVIPTTKSAVISSDGKFRYRLERRWDDTLPKVAFIMLNPSTADADKDDPTIRRCVEFAKAWGYGGIIVVNLYAFRSTDPRYLVVAEDAIGPENVSHVRQAAAEANLVICAWGNSGIVQKLQAKTPTYRPLENLGRDIHFLKLCKDGTPGHPLYLTKKLKPQKYNG